MKIDKVMKGQSLQKIGENMKKGETLLFLLGNFFVYQNSWQHEDNEKFSIMSDKYMPNFI